MTMFYIVTSASTFHHVVIQNIALYTLGLKAQQSMSYTNCPEYLWRLQPKIMCRTAATAQHLKDFEFRVRIYHHY